MTEREEGVAKEVERAEEIIAYGREMGRSVVGAVLGLRLGRDYLVALPECGSSKYGLRVFGDDDNFENTHLSSRQVFLTEDGWEYCWSEDVIRERSRKHNGGHRAITLAADSCFKSGGVLARASLKSVKESLGTGLSIMRRRAVDESEALAGLVERLDQLMGESAEVA